MRSACTDAGGRSARTDTGAVGHVVARMHDNNIALDKSLLYFRPKPIAITWRHFVQACTAVPDGEYGPTVFVAKQRAGRDLQDPIVLPQDETGFDPIAVTESLPV